MTQYVPASKDPESGEPAGPCVFCCQHVVHVNGGGPGWILGMVIGGKSAEYLYCCYPPCEPSEQARHLTAEYSIDQDPIWRCGCAPDYLESMGDLCYGCGRSRANRIVPECDIEGGS